MDGAICARDRRDFVLPLVRVPVLQLADVCHRKPDYTPGGLGRASWPPLVTTTHADVAVHGRGVVSSARRPLASPRPSERLLVLWLMPLELVVTIPGTSADTSCSCPP